MSFTRGVEDGRGRVEERNVGSRLAPRATALLYVEQPSPTARRLVPRESFLFLRPGPPPRLLRLRAPSSTFTRGHARNGTPPLLRVRLLETTQYTAAGFPGSARWKKALHVLGIAGVAFRPSYEHFSVELWSASSKSTVNLSSNC